jgi:rhamnosyltransferase
MAYSPKTQQMTIRHPALTGTQGMTPQNDRPPDVTILIRSKNEEKLLPRCLEMVFLQETTFSFEVLLIDSGSIDRTVTIARQFAGVVVWEIDPASFNYGRILNEGIQRARGRYVVALSAHCVPLDGHWLQNLVEPLEQTPMIGGSFSRQVPWPDCEPVERNHLQYNFGENDSVQVGDRSDGNPFQPLFSNASSCVRRELAIVIPFRALPWAEDRVWAHSVLGTGRAIAYASQSVVYHSHQRSLKGYYRMGYAEGQAHALLGCPALSLRSCPWFGVRPLWWTLRRWRKVCAVQGGSSFRIFRRALASLGRIISFDLGTWFGQRSVRKNAGTIP